MSNGVIVRGSNEESLIDIPLRTSENDFSSALNTNNRIKSTTTDRPSFLPPKETVVGNMKSAYRCRRVLT